MDSLANERTRTEQLSLAFDKAVVESIKTLNDGDLIEIFGDANQLFGNHLQRLYLNAIHKTESSIFESFQRLNEATNIEQVISRSIEGLDGDIAPRTNEFEGDDSLSEERPSRQIVGEAHELERQQLISTLQLMEFNVKKSRDLLARLRVQVANEVAAATEECEKMSQIVTRWKNTSDSRNDKDC